MDVGERLDALENRLAVIERALKITPPAADVTITPPGPGFEDRLTRIEGRIGKIDDALANLILDVEQMGQTAGKIAELEIDVSTASAKRKAKK